MPFKLKISKPAPPPWFHEYRFDKESVTIGREAKCDLQLEGINSVVSREHARISRKGDGHILVDLGSRNFTFFKGKKLKPGSESVLSEGDVFRICDYDIEFSMAEDSFAGAPAGSTVEEPPGPNPFADVLTDLAGSLERLSAVFNGSESPAKKDSLRSGLDKALGDLKDKKAVEILGDVLEGEKKRPTVSWKQGGPDVDVPGNDDRIGRLLDIFLEFFVKLALARRQFRMDFLGETVIKGKSFTFDDCLSESLKDYLFDPAVAPAESRTRMDLFQETLNDLLVHQFSLLEGYRAGVDDAARRFMDRMNPERLKKDVDEKTARLGPGRIPYRYLPIAKHFKLLQSYADAYRELASEDRAYIEQRYFRPAFKQGYYKCLRTPRRRKDGMGI